MKDDGGRAPRRRFGPALGGALSEIMTGPKRVRDPQKVAKAKPFNPLTDANPYRAKRSAVTEKKDDKGRTHERG